MTNREYDELRQELLSTVSYSSFSLTPCSAASVLYYPRSPVPLDTASTDGDINSDEFSR